MFGLFILGIDLMIVWISAIQELLRLIFGIGWCVYLRKQRVNVVLSSFAYFLRLELGTNVVFWQLSVRHFVIWLWLLKAKHYAIKGRCSLCKFWKKFKFLIWLKLIRVLNSHYLATLEVHLLFIFHKLLFLITNRRLVCNALNLWLIHSLR